LIRVGFIFNFIDQSWIGGINYYRNLIDAIQSNPDRQIEPVIFTGHRKNSGLIQEFHDVEIVRTRIMDRFYPSYILRHLWLRAFSYDKIMERLLIKHKIDVLSHSGFIGEDSRIPAIDWIPDFQHKMMPNFFSPDEIKGRDSHFERICKLSSCVILSSLAARRDAEQFYKSYASKFRVLHFVAGSIANSEGSDITTLERKYVFQRPYFLVPNQFWVHKNYHVILEALRILKSKNRKILVLATGNTQDYRQPEHFNSLMSLVTDYGISDSFKVLGIVPYSDLVGLMRNSVSLINPSLFEGWSTTVEEAKSLGKQIILSDIPVHREQAPEKGIFFEPTDAYELADSIWQAWISDDERTDPESGRRIQDDLKKRKQEFAKTYEGIVLDLMNSNSNRYF
jgi:glycosyltransferase involved in cell wall biosynthesis